MILLAVVLVFSGHFNEILLVVHGHHRQAVRLPSPNPGAPRVPVNAREDARVNTRGAALGVTATISGHRRHGLSDGEQQLALRPIRTKLELTAR